MKKAFTLIELLVVIAIIAILAAILFPVFAQAKAAAKKTAALSNAKQLGTSLAIYTTDSDDAYPTANFRYNNTWYNGYLIPSPAGAVTSGGWNAPALVVAEGNVVGNALLAYTKNQDIFATPGGLDTTIGDTFSGKPKPENLEMNGLMSQLNGSSVESPSIAVLFWGGMGNVNLIGRTFANPQLNCLDNNNDSCRFTPGGPPQAGMPDSNDGFYGLGDLNAGYRPFFYSHGVPIVHADTSAKYKKVGNVESSTAYTTACMKDPFAQVYPTDGAYGFTYFTAAHGDDDNCETDNDPWQYTGFFRPDKTKE